MTEPGRKRRYKQLTSLYVSMVLGVAAGIGVSVINTRFLGTEQYGDLKFLQNIFTFTVTFLTLGLFTTGSRKLAQRGNSSMRDVITGNLLFVAAMISLFMSFVLFCFSFYEERIFGNALGGTIRLFAPLLFIYPFQLCLESVMQGSNRIYELSAFRILPQILYMGVALGVNAFAPLNLSLALAIQFVVFGVAVGAIIFLLKPRFQGVRKHTGQLWHENKKYGLQVYFGSIAGVATAQLAGLSIGYFIDNTNVGFYALAMTITMPLAMIPNAVGTTFFGDFANSGAIMKSTLVMTLVLSLGALLVFVIVIKDLIVLLYTKDYLPVVPLAYTVAVGNIFYGFGDLFNRFLGAHGRGSDLRNGAIAVGLSNVFGFLVLVKFFGVNGAAATRVIAGVVYFLSMYFYYRGRKADDPA